MINTAPSNVVTPNEDPGAVGEPELLVVKGSLHYSSDSRQEEPETITVNRVVFTAQSPVEDFNEIAPDEMWLGEIDDIRFSFTSRSSFYAQAGLWHYVGDAVYPDMEPQIIDRANQFDAFQIVSNSLPNWLSMNGVAAEDYLPFSNPTLRLYPSYLVPGNLRPPFVSVHVEPSGTSALGAAPALGRRLTHTQLATDRVRLTLWGVKNDEAQNFVDFVNQFSLIYDQIGIMNMPILRDEKRTQSELSTIAQKKTIEYQVSYIQTSARDVARQLILRAIPTYIFPN